MTSLPLRATASDRLHALGLALPEPGQEESRYASFQRLGASICVSGQLPYVDGVLPAQGWSAVTSAWRRPATWRGSPCSTH